MKTARSIASCFIQVPLFLLGLLTFISCQECKDSQEFKEILSTITKEKYDVCFFTTTYSCAKCQVSKINNQIQNNPESKFVIIMFTSNSSPKVDTSGFDEKADIFFSKDMDVLNYVAEKANNKIGSYMIKVINDCELKIISF
jgi:hypothetical protein